MQGVAESPCHLSYGREDVPPPIVRSCEYHCALLGKSSSQSSGTRGRFAFGSIDLPPIAFL